MKSRHIKALVCILLAVVLVGSGVTVWLLIRTPVDTDPNAPFEDLSQWEKKQVLKAVSEYMTWWYGGRGMKFRWYGDPNSNQEEGLNWEKYKYGVQYYGTFGGYHIVLAPLRGVLGSEITRQIGEFAFKYGDTFHIFAYKQGEVVPLEEAYENGLLSDEQLACIFQCYQRYSQEIYPYWEYFPGR